MSTKKLIRDCRRALERDGFEVIEVGARGNTHVRLTVRDGSRISTLTMAASPSSTEMAITYTLAAARRHIRRGVA